MHRDLKLDNVMVNIEEDEMTGELEVVCKLTDFGFATHLDGHKEGTMSLCVGSLFAMAPEVLAYRYT